MKFKIYNLTFVCCMSLREIFTHIVQYVMILINIHYFVVFTISINIILFLSTLWWIRPSGKTLVRVCIVWNLLNVTKVMSGLKKTSGFTLRLTLFSTSSTLTSCHQQHRHYSVTGAEYMEIVGWLKAIIKEML